MTALLRLRPALLAGLCATAVAGCNADARSTEDRFTSTGELIALSGAGAGAQNACFTCHGLDGLGNGAGAPRLVGLPDGYLDRQLEAYADGRRKHPQMSWIASRLTGEQRMAVSQYYASRPYRPAPSAIPAQAPVLWVHGDPDRNLLPCAACHGLLGQGVGPANPPLGGQPAAYLSEQIEQWRHSRRRTDPGNVMLEISRRLTKQEAEALAAFASALPGDVRRRESRAASP